MPTFAAVASYDIAAAVRGQHGSGFGRDKEAVRNRALLDNLATAQFVLLDDLGKARATPAVAHELWAILDQRARDNLSTIWTANSTPEDIVRGMDEDMAGPLAGRLMDHSVILSLFKQADLGPARQCLCWMRPHRGTSARPGKGASRSSVAR